MLVDWVQAMPEPPQEVQLVHGEAEARRALAQALEIRIWPCLVDTMIIPPPLHHLLLLDFL
jgi:hypothetical protein